MSLVYNQSNYKFVQYAAEVMIYFERHKLIEIAKKILVECAIEQPADVQLWIAQNIKRIANEIYQDCLCNGKFGVIESLHLSAHYLYRIVMYGRPGSGRHTQAVYLSKRFNLVLIDAENLIYTNLRGDDDNPNDPLARELQRAFYYDNCRAKGRAVAALLGRRLLQSDCLTHGWILVNFPNTLEDFKEIMELSKIPPNKVVYLKCAQKICICRLGAKLNDAEPNKTFAYYDYEMRFFNQCEDEINDYLGIRHETLYVDAEESSQIVQTKILGLIQKYPYVMGFKQDLK